MDRNNEQSANTNLETDQTPFEHQQGSVASHINEENDLRVDVVEEELSASKRAVDRGSVNIEKNVVAEEQTLDVPVTEERVNVQRRTVDRPVSAGEDTFREGTIEVPVYGEEVNVEKSARVVEELEIEKEAVQATERVTGTVRHEEVIVDGEVVGGDTGTSSSSGGGGLLDKATDAITGRNKSSQG